MMMKASRLRPVEASQSPGDAEETLDRVFFALSDPVRRAILDELDRGPRLVSEIAAPFDISLQAVSRHIQMLVRAGLIRQARSGRISRCTIDVSPIFKAAVWINRHTKYWQAQFEGLKAALELTGAPGGRDHARNKRTPAKGDVR